MAKTYHFLVIGGGVYAAAFLYAASKYSNIRHICLIEKYCDFAMVHSRLRHNDPTYYCNGLPLQAHG